MNETNELKKPKIKNKKAEIIIEKKIHPIIIIYNIVFCLSIFYYSLLGHGVPFLVTFFLISITSFITYFNFYKRKIVITKNKLYIYRLGKKMVSISYASDFLYIKFEKTKLGRLLNYGTILVVTQNNTLYSVNFVREPEELFIAAIKEYENVISLINPKYEKQLDKENLLKTEEDFEKIKD